MVLTWFAQMELLDVSTPSWLHMSLITLNKPSFPALRNPSVPSALVRQKNEVIH